MSADAPLVSNAGPLMVLAKLNVLYLLKELYGRVQIPRSVYDEVVIEGMRQGYEDAKTLHLFLTRMGWSTTDVDSATIPAGLREAHLDRGERDTLALALALGDAQVLIDEAVGRRTARALGLTVRGSLGVLIEAYRQGFVGAEQLHLYFAEMVRRQDIWVSRALVNHLLREVLD